MKKYLQMLVLILLLIALPAIGFASADQLSETEEVSDGVVVRLNSDEQSYTEGDLITATITVSNQREEAIENLQVSNILPDGFELVSGDQTKQKTSLEPDESVSYTVVLKKVKSETVPIAGSEDEEDSGKPSEVVTPSSGQTENETTDNQEQTAVQSETEKSEQTDSNTTAATETDTANTKIDSSASATAASYSTQQVNTKDQGANVNTGTSSNRTYFLLMIGIGILLITGAVRLKSKHAPMLLSLLLAMLLVAPNVSIHAADLETKNVEKTLSVYLTVDDVSYPFQTLICYQITEEVVSDEEENQDEISADSEDSSNEETSESQTQDKEDASQDSDQKTEAKDESESDKNEPSEKTEESSDQTNASDQDDQGKDSADINDDTASEDEETSEADDVQPALYSGIIKADGAETAFTDVSGTVQDALNQAGITLSADDLVSPSLDTKLSDSVTTIVVNRVEYKEEVKTEKIPYGTYTYEDPDLEEGKTRTETKGEYGSKEVTYQIKYIDGEQADSKVISEKVTKEKVSEVIYKGTKVVEKKETSNQTTNSQGATVLTTTASSGWAWPLDASAGGAFYITSLMGTRESPGGIGSTNHQGTDIAANSNTMILAAQAGTVTQSGYNGGYGNSVTIQTTDGYTILCGHMSSVAVSVGQTVTKGQVIGYEGSTGNSTGPHLHFEVRKNGSAINGLSLYGSDILGKLSYDPDC